MVCFILELYPFLCCSSSDGVCNSYITVYKSVILETGSVILYIECVEFCMWNLVNSGELNSSSYSVNLDIGSEIELVIPYRFVL